MRMVAYHRRMDAALPDGPHHRAVRVGGLAAAVRQRRRHLGLKQVQLADLAGCSPRFLVALEQGKDSLRLDKVLDVLEALGLALAVVPGAGTVLAEHGR